MIVTKENVAAHAFAKHFLKLAAGHSLSAAVAAISGRGWHHARAEKL